MNESEVEELIEKLRNGDSSLTKLQLNHACLGSATMARIFKEMKPNSNIIEMQLRQNYIGSEGLSALLAALGEQRQLRAIDLRYNHLTAFDLHRLWRRIQDNFTLEDVRIDEDLGDEDEVPFQVLAMDSLENSPGLEWTTFTKQNLVHFRQKLQELLTVNRHINECIRDKSKELKLRFRSIERVPEVILLSHIKILDLRNNQISNLPLVGLDKMVELEELLLDNNRIRTLPRSLCSLQKLRVLSIRKNQLIDFPNSFCALTSLKELFVSSNDIQDIPIVLGALQNLEKLEIEENPFLRRSSKIPQSSSSLLSFLKEEVKSKGLPRLLKMRVMLLGMEGVGKSNLIRAIQTADLISKQDKKKKQAKGLTGKDSSKESALGLDSMNNKESPPNLLSSNPSQAFIHQKEALLNQSLQRSLIGGATGSALSVSSSLNLQSHLSSNSASMNNQTDSNRYGSPVHHRNDMTSSCEDSSNEFGPKSSASLVVNPVQTGQIDISQCLLPGSVYYTSEIQSKQSSMVSQHSTSISSQASTANLQAQATSNVPNSTQLVSSLSAADDLMITFWDFSGPDSIMACNQLFISDVQSCYIIVFDMLTPSEHHSAVEYWLQCLHQRAKDAPIILVGIHSDERKCSKEEIENTFRAILTRTCAETQYPNLRHIFDVNISNPASAKGLKKKLYQLAAIGDPDPEFSHSPIAVRVPESWIYLEEKLIAMRESSSPCFVKRGDVLTKIFSKTDKKSKMTLRKADTNAINNLSNTQNADNSSNGNHNASSNSSPTTTNNSNDSSQSNDSSSSQNNSSMKDYQTTFEISEAEKKFVQAYLATTGAIFTMSNNKQPTEFTVLNPQWLLDAFAVLVRYQPSSTSLALTGASPNGTQSGLTSRQRRASSAVVAAPTQKAGLMTSEDLAKIWKAPKFPTYTHQWLLSLFDKYELLYKLDSDGKAILVPWKLPLLPPSSMATLWSKGLDITEQRRYYHFSQAPSSLFFKLLLRLLVLADWETLIHWRYGIVLEDLRHSAIVLVQLDQETNMLKIHVRGRQQVLKMVAIAEAIESIMSVEVSSSSQKLKWQVMVPCRHCIQEGREADASLFPLASLEAAVNKNPSNALVNCNSGKKPKTVRVDWLAPDVALSTFSGDRIEFKDIQLGDIIGEGGYATVYKGSWQGKTVAVKQVKLVNIVNTESDNVFAEFRREVQLMSGLQHENLVVLKAICMEPFCMVLEFMEAGSLHDFTHSAEMQTLDWKTRLSLALDIAKGMAFLHGILPPIVHRDLKSPNILLTLDPKSGRLRAKVADFGLSRSLDFSNELDGRSLEGHNPVWLAPEILLHQNYNEKVDVYSYGLILFEMLSGQDYFGDVAFMSDIEEFVTAGTRPKIQLVEYDPFNVQSDYVDLIQQCWDNDAKERPTFAHIVAVLTDLLRKTGENIVEETKNVDEAEANTQTFTQDPVDQTQSSRASTSIRRDIMKEYQEQQQRETSTSNEDDSEGAPLSPPLTQRSATESPAVAKKSSSPTDSSTSSPSTSRPRKQSEVSASNESVSASSSATSSKSSKEPSKVETPKLDLKPTALAVDGLSPGVRAQLSPRMSIKEQEQKEKGSARNKSVKEKKSPVS